MIPLTNHRIFSVLLSGLWGFVICIVKDVELSHGFHFCPVSFLLSIISQWSSLVLPSLMLLFYHLRLTCIDPMLSTRPMSSVVNPSGFLARIPDILMVYLARFLFSDHSLCLLPVCFQCFLCLCLWRQVHVNGYQLWLLNSGFVLPHRLSRLPTWTVGFVHEGQWSDNHSLPCNGTWLF